MAASLSSISQQSVEQLGATQKDILDLNPVTPESDKHLISPYNITP